MDSGYHTNRVFCAENELSGVVMASLRQRSEQNIDACSLELCSSKALQRSLSRVETGLGQPLFRHILNGSLPNPPVFEGK